MWAPECACTEHWSSSCKPLVSLLLSVPPSHPSPQKIKAPPQRPECTQPRSRAATGPWASRPALRAWEEATQKLLLTPPALALHVRIQGRPGAAHPSPGREPPELLHSGPSPEALASSLRAALCPSSPPPPRRNAAKEPFSRQKKKKNRSNELAFRVDRNKVMKFITAGKQVLTGSHLRCPREWNRRASRGTVAGRSAPLGPRAGALELTEAAARRAVSLRPTQGTPGTAWVGLSLRPHLFPTRARQRG